jgi:uncharacterized membrane protein
MVAYSVKLLKYKSNYNNMQKSNRMSEIDFLRGIAIIMMIIFHFMWDLAYFNLSNADLYSSFGFWSIFQKITGGLFIFLVGLSLTLSYWRTAEYKGVYPKKFLLRGAKIFGLGLIITLFSYIFMPDSFVFFGILHFIGIAIILATPFIRFTYLNLALSIASIIISLFISKITLSPWLVWLGFNYSVSTLDIYQVFPWIFLVFLGMFIGNMLYPKGKRLIKLNINKTIIDITRPVQFLGRHALTIYFLHIPLMFGVAYILSMLTI